MWLHLGDLGWVEPGAPGASISEPTNWVSRRGYASADMSDR